MERGENKVPQGKYTLPRVMTVKEIATYLRVHPSTIYKLLRIGELPGFRIASEWRFNSATIDRWLLERDIRRAGDELLGRTTSESRRGSS
jgi:excisionase family DNA binding protein